MEKEILLNQESLNKEMNLRGEMVTFEEGDFIEDECVIENVSLMCGINNAQIAR